MLVAQGRPLRQSGTLGAFGSSPVSIDGQPPIVAEVPEKDGGGGMGGGMPDMSGMM